MSTKNKVWYHKDGKNKYFDKDEIIPEGYEKGQVPHNYKNLHPVKCEFCNKEFKDILSLRTHKWRCPQNPDKKEYSVWNKGLTKNENESLKIQGEKHSKTMKEYYSKHSAWNKGKKTSEEVRLRQSEAKRRYYDNGGISPKKGKKLSEETKQKIRDTKSKQDLPNFTGSGYTGKYKDLWFRSLLELAVICYYEKSGIKLKNAEKVFKIKLPNGSYYRPDFYYDNNIIEVKPNYSLKSCKHKIKAGKLYCKNNGFNYIIKTEKDIPYMKPEEMIELIKIGKIKFTDKMLKRFEKNFCKGKSIFNNEEVK